MSHVATVDVQVTNLEDLRAACQRLGLEFAEGQTTYRWYGTHVGDYPLPAGFSAADLGSCEHAIRVPGNLEAYEVGVVRRRDGKPGWQLMWDFYLGGFGLEQHVGTDCGLLRQSYATVAATRAARQQGFTVQERKLASGEIKLVLSR